MFGRVAFIVALSLVPVSAIAGGTAEEQSACKPDVIKFCKSAAAGNDEIVILGCLQGNRDKLSKGCRKVLESHGV